MRTWQSKCAAWRKRANLRKNHRFGNVNTQVCVLTRAKLDLLRCSAQPVAQTALRWWQQTRLLSKTAFVLATTNRAIARMLSNQARERVIVAIPHDRLLGEACCATQDGQYFCRYIACLVACRSARCFAIGAVIFAFGKRFQDPLLCPTLLFLKVRSSPLYARTYTYIHARTDSFIQEL